MGEEILEQPWVAELRRRCPLLELGFRLEEPPREEADDEPPAEEVEPDPFAELADPKRVLLDQLHEAGDVAAEVVVSLRRRMDVGQVPAGGGAEFLQRVSETMGEALAVDLGEIGHKLSLLPPDDVPAFVSGAVDAAEVTLAGVVKAMLVRINQEVG